MENHLNVPDKIPLSVERDADGKITGWEMTLKRKDAIAMLREIIREATEQGDTATARGAKKFLQCISGSKNRNGRKNKQLRK